MTVHVLNGDALLERFPDALPGERLVFRECLIEGPPESPDGFFAAREGYLAERYGTDGPDYARDVRTGRCCAWPRCTATPSVGCSGLSAPKRPSTGSGTCRSNG